ncbi:unnamed protein product [Ostreobium quekettii]|uniref:Uncharacterized protein n=1 Tax=Ostreobium quekettii TaxID=121088 RepID=A0A8S1IUJ8_9CHLO|nr:unnamed protein product [Ostreobium quekettii]
MEEAQVYCTRMAVACHMQDKFALLFGLICGLGLERAFLLKTWAMLAQVKELNVQQCQCCSGAHFGGVLGIVCGWKLGPPVQCNTGEATKGSTVACGPIVSSCCLGQGFPADQAMMALALREFQLVWVAKVAEGYWEGILLPLPRGALCLR